MIFFASSAATEAHLQGGAQSALGLLVLIVVAGAWIGMRWLFRKRHEAEAEAVVHGDFAAFALEALANAARIDGGVHESERQAIQGAMGEIAGQPADPAGIDRALAQARLSKDQLVDYLRERASRFSREEKTLLLKSLLALIVADHHFDETEHAVLMDYTAAIGFDRQSAPQLLRGLVSDFAKGRMT